jgi:hypothetical protein
MILVTAHGVPRHAPVYVHGQQSIAKVVSITAPTQTSLISAQTATDHPTHSSLLGRYETVRPYVRTCLRSTRQCNNTWGRVWETRPEGGGQLTHHRCSCLLPRVLQREVARRCRVLLLLLPPLRVAAVLAPTSLAPPLIGCASALPTPTSPASRPCPTAPQVAAASSPTNRYLCWRYE